MKVSVFNPLRGTYRTMDLPLTREQYIEGKTLRDRGATVQEAYPYLSAGHREFLISGITPDEWDEMFGEWDKKE